jgi:hypothetical protein
MLDYLKEANSLKKQENASGAAEQGQAAPQDDFIVPAAQERSVKQGTVLLIILFAVGAGVLWFMVKKAAPQAANAAVTAEDSVIESALAKVTGSSLEVFKSVDSVMSKFSDYSKARQVKVNELQKNPFTHDKYAHGQVVRESAGGDDSEELDARAMQLQSIIKTPRGNCCMIDDHIAYKGQAIQGWKITAIGDKSVELSSPQGQVTLRIGEGQ